ncbi:hypothetical protein WMY93_030949 [Mugilogobius chulae]|uniref:Uncharacterized protein n=1 Tax=Mugilogobius chulae TaxID=88201 RepID=A0AAW0MHC4_9GOBI
MDTNSTQNWDEITSELPGGVVRQFKKGDWQSRVAVPLFKKGDWQSGVAVPLFKKRDWQSRVAVPLFKKEDWQSGVAVPLFKKGDWQSGVAVSLFKKGDWQSGVVVPLFKKRDWQSRVAVPLFKKGDWQSGVAVPLFKKRDWQSRVAVPLFKKRDWMMSSSLEKQCGFHFGRGTGTPALYSSFSVFEGSWELATVNMCCSGEGFMSFMVSYGKCSENLQSPEWVSSVTAAEGRGLLILRSSDTTELTQEKNHTSVNCVRKGFVKQELSKFTSESTLEKNRTSVIFVRKRL